MNDISPSIYVEANSNREAGIMTRARGKHPGSDNKVIQVELIYSF